ncbi:hypothetical protein N7510_008145 [Penicillium lagena]|uniref:uncharacterized protein n=1 Tax=Penicillium lagena TaxID=94218 RepID=UPI00254085FF|nr:uncharacterized protein N7510_008145 [Penicillium lagena]KAJ5611426.1 hypothetical protein N7510_008145 [Penicillium lagena]
MADPKSIDEVFTACGLVWEQSENLILCQRCQSALYPRGSQVTQHLHSKHRVPLPLRKGLTEPSYATPRPDGSPADARLRLYTGYTCRQCAYRTISRDLLGRHLSQEHLQQQRASHRRANDLYNDVYL